MISNITIDGYKSLVGPIRLDTSNLNVLVGANASGKSSILQILLLIRQSASKEGIVDGLRLTGQLYEAGTAQDVLHPEAGHKISVRIQSANTLVDWTFSYDRASDVGAATRLLKSRNSSRAPAQLYQDYNVFAYLNAERVGPRVSHPLPPEEALLAGAVGKHGEYTAAVLARSASGRVIAGWVPFPPNSSESISAPLIKGPSLIDGLDVREQVENTGGRIDLLSNIMLNWIIPGAIFTANENSSVDSAAIRYVRDPHHTKTEVRSTHIGFGLSYTLPIIVAALSLTIDGMLLVENPEAHLHPYSQSRIGVFLALMAAAGRQIFVETHSDHVINGIRLAIKRGVISNEAVKINFLERLDNENRSNLIQIRSDANGRLDKWPSGFFDQIENDLSRL
jgi:predicted ATPase